MCTRKSLKRTFKTSFWIQNHLLNLWSSFLNLRRLLCSQKNWCKMFVLKFSCIHTKHYSICKKNELYFLEKVHCVAQHIPFQTKWNRFFKLNIVDFGLHHIYILLNNFWPNNFYFWLYNIDLRLNNVDFWLNNYDFWPILISTILISDMTQLISYSIILISD